MEEVAIPELFKYEHAVVPEDCMCLVSPSQLSKFFEYPKIWYLENLSGEKPEFKGNTSTVLGTICHYIYECVAQNMPVNREEINNALDSYLKVCPNEDVDKDLIKELYPQITGVVVNEYILPNLGKNVSCEQKIVHKIDKGVYLAGTYDRLEEDILCDYKTVATKPNETSIPFHYKIQLLAYAHALRQQGKEVNRIRLIYGVRPTKTIPARCFVVTEEIDDNAEKLIVDTLNLISETVIMSKDHPELIHLLFKSMDLKND